MTGSRNSTRRIMSTPSASRSGGRGTAGGLAGALALRRADAQAAVAERGEAADHHQEATEPDPRHQRLVVDAHRPAALAVAVADDDVEVGEEGGTDRRLGGRLGAHVVNAL